MTINEACEQYELENDKERKNALKQLIIKYCNDNPDNTIPKVASKIYVEYLCKM